MGGIRKLRRSGLRQGFNSPAIAGKREVGSHGHLWSKRYSDDLTKYLYNSRKKPEHALAEFVDKPQEIAFKSKMEANYARWLEYLREKQMMVTFADGSKAYVRVWLYEPCRFWFPVARGINNYVPDFLVIYSDLRVEFHEVKGGATVAPDGSDHIVHPASRTKVNRFRQYFPELRLDVIGNDRYGMIQSKLRRVIPEWE